MAITDLQDIFGTQIAGDAYQMHIAGLATGTTDTAAATSNSVTMQMMLNSIGSTAWGTRVGIKGPAGITGRQSLLHHTGVANRTGPLVLARLYEFGTATFSSTVGNRLTHSAGTFPMLRTRFGHASQRLPLIPVMLVTTATATTAPQFTYTYNDQAGGSIGGSKVFTFPAAATRVGSMFQLPTEQNTSGVTDISAVTCTVAGTAGTVTMFGMDIIDVVPSLTGVPFNQNAVVNPHNMATVEAWPATSGSVTSILCYVMAGASAASSTTLGIADLLIAKD
jgi:hypothetical protein